MVKIADKSNHSRFARPASEDKGIWLDHVEVHLVTHPSARSSRCEPMIRRKIPSSSCGPGGSPADNSQ
jgi:hypothetical protein